jgi:hypothetical protein
MTAVDQPTIANELAADPNVVRILLTRHQPDQAGRCSTCRDRTAAPIWPCRLHGIAQAAQAIVDARGGVR